MPGRPARALVQDLDLVLGIDLSKGRICRRSTLRSGKGKSLLNLRRAHARLSTSISSGGTVLGVLKATKCVFFSQENCRPQ